MSYEETNDYIEHCLDRFNFLVNDQDTPRDYLHARSAATFLGVVSTAPLGYPDDAPEADKHRIQLARVFQFVMRIAQNDPTVTTAEMQVHRAVLDCYGGLSADAEAALSAAKCAIAAHLLIQMVVLDDFWSIEAPEVWSLVLAGGIFLEQVDEKPWVVVNQSFVDRMRMERAKGITDSMGAPPPSAN